MIKLTKSVLAIFLAAAFATGSVNLSATETATSVQESVAKTPSAAESMKMRSIENVLRGHASVSRSMVR